LTQDVSDTQLTTFSTALETLTGDQLNLSNHEIR